MAAIVSIGPIASRSTLLLISWVSGMFGGRNIGKSSTVSWPLYEAGFTVTIIEGGVLVFMRARISIWLLALDGNFHAANAADWIIPFVSSLVSLLSIIPHRAN